MDIESVVCILVFLAVPVLAAFLMKFFNTYNKNRQVQILQDNADYVVENIRYVKDIRTNLCFAYYWDGRDNGGRLVLTLVPCEAVPPQLLMECSRQ